MRLFSLYYKEVFIMDYNTLLQAHGIDINDCCKFESFCDETQTIIFIKLKTN